MASRMIAHQGRTWAVHPAAERQSNTADWQLIFGFRPEGKRGSVRTLWAPHPFTSVDKASLLRQAELVTDYELVTLLDSVVPRLGG